ncbi:MAG: FprA family A-type flavoprotein, partial [Candidatus Methanomethyliaceae archaeon]|nr:FprA family A-type flavoprotein [Candidatus Methanomethyliaceae archaeon]
MKIDEGIFWVGVIDWDIRDFHGYLTKRGTTYNAYFIKDEKKVLVDTVKYNFCEELIKKINEISKVEELDYIVINHVEMDHSSSLSHVIERAKRAKIITSKRGEEGLKKYYGENLNIEVVKTGDQLNIGRKTLTFIEAPMLHWPDSMFTYTDGILIPNDAFGQHLASSGRYDDEVNEEVLMEEATKYYANILMPLSDLIIRKLQELEKMNLPIKIIAPSHGIIWRSNPSKIIDAYRKWSEGITKEKMIVVYDTMWRSTETMARKIAEGAMSQGIEVKVFKLRASDATDIVTEILDAGAVVVGSPTINNSMFPTVSAFMNYIVGLKPKKKIWAFFGSYGWG